MLDPVVDMPDVIVPAAKRAAAIRARISLSLLSFAPLASLLLLRGRSLAPCRSVH
jgi:hypothetical protein